MTMPPEASPLSWPFGYPRTPDAQRTRSAFSRDRHHAPTISRCRMDLEREFRLLGVRDYLISTNLELRLDGNPRSGQPEPRDPGVAVYFTLKGRPIVLPCDRWDRVADNLRAVVKHIESIRGQNRWGVGTVEQAFAGYAALPAPGGDAERPWREVMGFQPRYPVTVTELGIRYRGLAKAHSNDEGLLRELNVARDQARKELGV